MRVVVDLAEEGQLLLDEEVSQIELSGGWRTVDPGTFALEGFLEAGQMDEWGETWAADRGFALVWVLRCPRFTFFSRGVEVRGLTKDILGMRFMPLRPKRQPVARAKPRRAPKKVVRP